MKAPPNHIVEDARRRANHAPIQRFDFLSGDVCGYRCAAFMETAPDGQYVRYDDIKPPPINTHTNW